MRHKLWSKGNNICISGDMWIRVRQGRRVAKIPTDETPHFQLVSTLLRVGDNRWHLDHLSHI